jgi:hypothetical protein
MSQSADKCACRHHDLCWHRKHIPTFLCHVLLSQDFAPPTGIPGVGAANSNSMVHYSQHNSSSGLLLDPSLPADALAVTLAAKRASLMERESALQVRHSCWASLHAVSTRLVCEALCRMATPNHSC